MNAGTLTTLVVCACAPLWGASARGLIAEGNQAYFDGDYEQALAAYLEASRERPDVAHFRFNTGAALYRKGEFEAAAEAYERAARLAAGQGDLELESAAWFGLGNSSVRLGQTAAESNAELGIGALRKGIHAYREALRLKPQDGDAARNLEIAKSTLRELLANLKNQPPSPGKSDEGEKRLAEDVEDALRRQQELNREREDIERERSAENRPGAERNRSEDLARRQQELRQETERLRNETGGESSEEAREKLERAAENQRQAAERLSQDDAGGAREPQQAAAENLRAAAEALSGQGAASDPTEDGGSLEAAPPAAGRSTRLPVGRPGSGETQAADAQRILDDEQRYRRQREVERLGRSQPVDKDW